MKRVKNNPINMDKGNKLTIDGNKVSTAKKANPQGVRNENKSNINSDITTASISNISSKYSGNIAILFVIAIVLMFVPDVAEAAKLDMSKTTSVLKGFADGLRAICGIAATIMAIYTGFKFYKGGSPLADLTTNFWAIGAFATATAIGDFVGRFVA